MGLTLITGASGFVGGHLVHEMRKRGLPVRGVSRQKTPGLLPIPSYGSEVDWTVYLADVNAVVHLAARVHVMRETATEPLAEFRAANVDATLNLARQAARAGVRRFIFVSTIKVNGESTEPGKPFTANDPANPQDPYAISKAEAESALVLLGRETGMEIVIIRPPLIYGPGVKGNFRSLIKWASIGLPSIFSGIDNRRSLVFVDNLCDLIVTTLTLSHATNGIFLVSDDRALSTDEILRVLAAASGRKARGVNVPYFVLRTLAISTFRKDSLDRLTSNLEVDATVTRERLSWNCPHDVLTGLSATARSP
ncbi:MAG: NAD-dependent epimerase/dehydratase family protein [Allorhizobium sp.]